MRAVLKVRNAGLVMGCGSDVSKSVVMNNSRHSNKRGGSPTSFAVNLPPVSAQFPLLERWLFRYCLILMAALFVQVDIMA